MSVKQICTDDYTRHGTDYSKIWSILESTVFQVVDEDGVNVENAEVRHLLDGVWLMRDDVDGYQTIDEFAVESLWLEESR